MKVPAIGWFLDAKEGENIEFKRAENTFEFDELAKYVCALANRGGGYYQCRTVVPREPSGALATRTATIAKKRAVNAALDITSACDSAFYMILNLAFEATRKQVVEQSRCKLPMLFKENQ